MFIKKAIELCISIHVLHDKRKKKEIAYTTSFSNGYRHCDGL